MHPLKQILLRRKESTLIYWPAVFVRRPAQHPVWEMNPEFNQTPLVFLNDGYRLFDNYAASPALNAAAHPVLTDPVDASRWHVPLQQDEAVFIGDAASGDPKLAIRKSATASQPLVLRVAADAQQCVLRSGHEEVHFALNAGGETRIMLDGRSDRPRLTIEGSESPALQGRWIRLIGQDNQAEITLQLLNATYATVRFTQPGARVRRYVAPQPGGELALVKEGQEDANSLTKTDASYVGFFRRSATRGGGFLTCRRAWVSPTLTFTMASGRRTTIWWSSLGRG